LAKKKYLISKGFFGSNQRGASQFWKGLNKAKNIVRGGMKYIHGNGRKIIFWHEVWLGECPLRIKYVKLYNICNQQEWEVSRVLGVG
jgi:hypothetical protein